MAGHLLGVLESSVVLQVNRDTGCSPGVTSDRGEKTRRLARFLDERKSYRSWKTRPSRVSPELLLRNQFFLLDKTSSRHAPLVLPVLSTGTTHDVPVFTRIRVSGLFNLELADRSSAHPLQRSTEQGSAREKKAFIQDCKPE
jgi:hypothetical protein